MLLLVASFTDPLSCDLSCAICPLSCALSHATALLSCGPCLCPVVRLILSCDTCLYSHMAVTHHSLSRTTGYCPIHCPVQLILFCDTRPFPHEMCPLSHRFTVRFVTISKCHGTLLWDRRVTVQWDSAAGLYTGQ